MIASTLDLIGTASIKRLAGWVTVHVHACKTPCHQRAVGYQGSLPSRHPHYLVLERPNNLYLDMIDPSEPLFMPPLFSEFIKFARQHEVEGPHLSPPDPVTEVINSLVITRPSAPRGLPLFFLSFFFFPNPTTNPKPKPFITIIQARCFWCRRVVRVSGRPNCVGCPCGFLASLVSFVSLLLLFSESLLPSLFFFV